MFGDNGISSTSSTIVTITVGYESSPIAFPIPTPSSEPLKKLFKRAKKNWFDCQYFDNACGLVRIANGN